MKRLFPLNKIYLKLTKQKILITLNDKIWFLIKIKRKKKKRESQSKKLNKEKYRFRKKNNFHITTKSIVK